MVKGSWRAWTVALSTTTIGCALVAGIDKDYHPLGEGGAGGAGMGGLLGEACPEVGALTCAGNAQKSKLICGPDKKWATNGTCDGDALCDTLPGVDQGACKPVVAVCAGKKAADVVCDGAKRVKCGPDRVTAEDVETCPYGCSGGACAVLPNCAGLPQNCGIKGDESCCATGMVVTGGTYNRSKDPMFPATVSSFQLDRFEITVGRFRAFVAAYPGSKPAAGAGAHPRIAGSGWDAAWDMNLPLDLKEAVKCDSAFRTWTDEPGANEDLPMNCISWYEAFAFCAWDGGRLPTEAEWNYAAAGGSEQREYPWGSEAPDAMHAVFDCTGNGSLGCDVGDIQKVGSRPAGDSKWSQADLAGNVWEWNLDWYKATYPTTTCNDCANLETATLRVVRGGSWGESASALITSTRSFFEPSARNDSFGARCARTP